MIVIYHLSPEGQPAAEKYFDSEFMNAMGAMEKLRKAGHTHVVMSNEPANMVGKPGVDTVADGKTPDGVAYDWSKADRAGKTRKSDANKPVLNDGEPVRATHQS